MSATADPTAVEPVLYHDLWIWYREGPYNDYMVSMERNVYKWPYGMTKSHFGSVDDAKKACLEWSEERRKQMEMTEARLKYAPVPYRELWIHFREAVNDYVVSESADSISQRPRGMSPYFLSVEDAKAGIRLWRRERNETLGQAIRKLSKYVRDLSSRELRRDSIITLLCADTKLARKTVTEVLDALENLERRHVQ